ncbi:MAG: Gfo/Idh/MocA family oxidoreductase [Acidobacteriota bacterium]
MDQHRRNFIKDSLGATAAIAAAPMFVPAGAFGANERLAYGLIGAGGRGRYMNQVFQKLGAQCVALCDVYEPYLKLAQEKAPEAKTYTHHHDLLAQPGIDFVVIATPDHHHCPNLLDALAAGKDAYLEKPMSHSLEQSRKMIEATRKTKRIVQIGMQRRSAPVIAQAEKLIADGVLGKIAMVKPMWNWNISRPLDNSPLPGSLDWQRFLGPARKRDLEPMRFRTWRCFWDYSGGHMTDQGTHLMDCVQRLTRSGPPRAAVCWGQVVKMTGSEAPEVFCAVFEYASFVATWTLNYCNSYENGWSIQYMGDQGTMILDEEGYRVYKEPWAKKENRTPIYDVEQGVPIEAHVQNFLDCVKSRQEPNCPVEIGAQAVSGPHLANLAYHKGRQMHLSPDGFKAS